MRAKSIRRSLDPEREKQEIILKLNPGQVAAINALLKLGLYGNTPASVAMRLVDQQLISLAPK